MRDQYLKIVLFCGGRGSASIVRECLRRPNIHLTLIVNAYDDGLSTGALREFIPNMLGPSDFRKNLSSLLDLHSNEQYALKNLLEFRLPPSITAGDVTHWMACVEQGQFSALFAPLGDFFQTLNAKVLATVRKHLTTFFHFAKQHDTTFDFRDCAVGNLIFAGAYLEHNNFNSAIFKMGQLVHSRMALINVSHGENRILTGLKENGELLMREAEIVGQQSAAPIRNIYFLPAMITSAEQDWLATQSLLAKEQWLQQKERLPKPSTEAISAVMMANIIIYGPGTQYSSLLPSYRIIAETLQHTCALKFFVMNLAPDHDIQSLDASAVIDKTLVAMGDPQNQHKVITHILLDNQEPFGLKSALHSWYKNASVIKKPYANYYRRNAHNGHAVVTDILNIDQYGGRLPAMDIFIDVNKRSLAISALYEEFLEMSWHKHFSKTSLTINRASVAELDQHVAYPVNSATDTALFPEIKFLTEWLTQGTSEYLVLWTGDGEYRFREIGTAVQLLEKTHFGAVYGSRTQSRRQLQASLQAAYGENRLLRAFSFCGALLVSFLFSLRFGVIFSDPLTGLRIYRRSTMCRTQKKWHSQRWVTPIHATKYLLKQGIDIAELPISYRTFSGFTNPYWRINRGLKNLFSIFT